MKVIFRADDLGMSEGINYGIAKAISCGPITSVGLMPNMPAAAHGFDLVAKSGVSVGQHTNICLGKPISDPASIPSLVDEHGLFCSSRTIRARTEDTIKRYPLPAVHAEWAEFYENIYDVLRNGAMQLITHDQLRRSMRLMEAIFRSAEENQVVKDPLGVGA